METKALVLIQKHESFKMEENENIEEMFSRFQTLVACLRVLNKGYTTADHDKKIIISLPQKWRTMVTALKISRDLNSTTLEELISSLRSHEIELEADEPVKKAKSVALKSSLESEEKNIPHTDADEICSEDVGDEEVSLLSQRINQLWKHWQRRLRTFNKGGRRSESTSNTRKPQTDRKVVCFECQEPGHYRSECPKLNKEKPKNNSSKKKVLMATWGDSDGETEEDNIAPMAHTEASDAESDSDFEEVFSKFTRLELESSLNEILGNNHKLHAKLRSVNQALIARIEEHDKTLKDNANLKEEIAYLEKESLSVKNKMVELEAKLES
jgi:hypothetical protein